MKLRLIIIFLSLTAFLSAWSGGYLYYSSTKKAALDEANRQASLRTESIKNHIIFFLQENLNTVIALAGLEELSAALTQGDPATLGAANAILDHFQSTYRADVCYLIDRDGFTIASSNRHQEDSFVGHNYGFRPYFQHAIQGDPDAVLVYKALGVTSGKRGIYYSYPVFGDLRAAPLGVAVIKAPIEPMERELVRDYEGVVMLTDPHGLVFNSNRKEWILKSLFALSDDEVARLQETRQFGPGPWEWTGLKLIDGTHAVDGAGSPYLFHQLALDPYPGWNLIFLNDIHPILKRVHEPLIRSSGYPILALCLLVALVVALLFKTANREINRRLQAEEALRLAHHDLEKRVADRTVALTRSVGDLQKEIAERKRVEEALRGSEDKHRTLLENLSVGVFRNTPGPKGNHIDVNSAYVRMFGFADKADLLARHVSDLYQTPGDRDAFSKKMIRNGAVKNEEIIFKRKDGTPFLGSVTAVAVKDAHGNVSHYDGILEDITELRHAKSEARKRREEIAHLGRVATMGELSASLAHELNQPLAAILSNAQAALRFLSANPVDLTMIRDILTDIVADDRRAGNVIQRLRTLFQKGEIQRVDVDINALIREVVSLVTTETMIRNVAIATELDSSLLPVSGDRIHLQQVLINLILNASDAMTEGANGRRRIVISSTKGDGNTVRVGVRDNGTGLAEDILDRIMEPFFTTKSKGMGMGLSINRTIINSHAGRMWAENNPDKGATFYFTLPAHHEV